MEAQESNLEQTSLLGFVPLILLLILVVVPCWKIWTRTGNSGAWSLLMVLPIINIVSLWVLAYKRWPALENNSDVADD